MKNPACLSADCHIQLDLIKLQQPRQPHSRYTMETNWGHHLWCHIHWLPSGQTLTKSAVTAIDYRVKTWQVYSETKKPFQPNVDSKLLAGCINLQEEETNLYKTAHKLLLRLNASRRLSVQFNDTQFYGFFPSCTITLSGLRADIF